MTVVRLTGCTPEPMASYLKALGTLRIVSQQIDHTAAGFWEKGCFHLDSKLDNDALTDFFLKTYRPTPIVAPWLGGSGFYEGDSRDGMNRILASSEARLSEYRATIKEVESWPEMPRKGARIRQMADELETKHLGKEGKSHEEYRKLIGAVRSLCADMASLHTGSNPLDWTVDEVAESTPPPGLPFNESKRWTDRKKELRRVASKLRTSYKSDLRSGSKETIVRLCRNRLGEGVVDWVDAAAPLDGHGDPVYPPLLGTGGNEGRQNYTRTFMDHIAGSLLGSSPSESRSLLCAALFGSLTRTLVRSPFGQLDPARAGGFNQGSGVEAIESKEQPSNPWDFILAMEGSITWSSSITRRGRAGPATVLSSPFSVRASPVGYPSATGGDGAESKLEVWTPLWSAAVGYPELQAFLGESRADVGKHIPRNGVEFAEAVASLGVDRGIEEFVRHSILPRRGQSFVVTAIGRFPVEERRESDLLRQLGSVLRRLDPLVSEPSPRYVSARRGVDAAIYEAALKGGKPSMKSLVAAIGRLERVLQLMTRKKGPKAPPPPPFGLGGEWVDACDDGSIEIRLASALASITKTDTVGPMRASLVPINPANPRKWAEAGSQDAWVGADLSDRMSSVLARRVMDAERLQSEESPLRGFLPVNAEDVAAFISGEVDETLMEAFLFGFGWIDWRRAVQERSLEGVRARWSSPVARRPVDTRWALIKALFMAYPLDHQGDKVRVPAQPSVLPLLRGGRVAEACRTARRRLYSLGFGVPAIEYPDGPAGRRIAAALLFPVAPRQRWLREALGDIGTSNTAPK
jgi:CRISPR-associated protein Csx17